jgi:peptidoglycan/LPS O-acetylase OafA/YrhL
MACPPHGHTRSLGGTRIFGLEINRLPQTPAAAQAIVWAENWNYSLYFIHPIAIAGFRSKLPEVASTSRAGWLASMGLILASSCVFYLLVERPAHPLAKKIRLVPGSRLTPVPAGSGFGPATAFQ